MPTHTTTTQPIQLLLLLLLQLLLLPNTLSTSPLHPDARALLAFKSKADLSNKLKLTLTNFTYCHWNPVQCDRHGKIHRLVLQDFSLGGIFPPHSLSRLDQLRVLSLQNNSLTGPIPDLSGLVNLKNLFLSHNSFTGSFPLSISDLHRIKTLDFSYNNLTGPIPIWIFRLDRLCYLRLESNRFNGSVPVLNQSSLVDLDLSRNNLSGAVPVTPVLLRFGPASFSRNPGLCGEIVGKECHSSLPFFPSTVTTAPATPPPAVVLGQIEALRGVEVNRQSQEKHERIGFVWGFSCGLFGMVVFLVCFMVVIRQRRSKSVLTATMVSDVSATSQAAAVTRMEQDNELGEKVKKVQVAKSGCIVFCAGERQLYTVEQLMSASAELLGRGSIGTTYKAVLDNRLIICVKRLDAAKTTVTSSEMFERHMTAVGGLRHPNLVPLRAYLQAKEERLLVYDYQPNGSVLSLIHGSKSTRAKPLHWTSCLKIAEDVAQGLSYIHQAWRLVHGNLKSSNILLGPDFEACLTDYCLNVLMGPSAYDDPSYDGYIAPETRKYSHHSTTKSDVYAFGILLLELLTATPPPQHPFQLPDDVVKWVRGVREDDGVEDCMLGMLLEIAIACRAVSPEQRPSMWQVLKMIQEIKDTVLLGDDELGTLARLS